MTKTSATLNVENVKQAPKQTKATKADAFLNVENVKQAPKQTKATKADAFVLCAGDVAGVRYPAGAIIEGVPNDVVEAHKALLDPHSSAISYARKNQAEIFKYEG